MANLLSVAELAWKQLFPESSDESKVKKEQFIADSKTEYAYQLWLRILNDKNMEGQIDIPSYLLSEIELDVANDEMDISGLKIMRSLPFEVWLQNVGGINCDCQYVKTTFNLAQTLCDDDSLGDNAKTFYPLGKRIKFPKGVHKNRLPITYANNGENINGMIEVDDAIGGLVRRSLIELYGGKTGKEDKTNNTNPES